MKALMEKLIQDDNANNDKEKDSKLNENKRSPGKLFTLRSIGGIFPRQIDVSFSFLLSYFEFRFCLESLCIGCLNLLHLFFLFSLLNVFLFPHIYLSFLLP